MKEEKKKSAPQYWKWLLLAFALVGVGVVTSIDLQNQDGYILISTLDNETWNLNFNETKLPESFTYTWTDPGQPEITPLEDLSGLNGTSVIEGTIHYLPTEDAYFFNNTGGIRLEDEPYFSPYNSGKQFTVWARFKIVDNTGGVGSDGRKYVIGKGGSSNFEWRMTRSRTGQKIVCQTFSLSGASGLGIDAVPAPFDLTTIYDVSCVMNGTHLLTYNQGSLSGSGSLGSTIDGDGNARAYIGRESSTDYFGGNIYEVRLYNRTLSGAELLALTNNETVDDTGLVAYYPFLNQSYVAPQNYSTLQIPLTPEPINASPGTLWADRDTNESYVLNNAGWQLFS